VLSAQYAVLDGDWDHFVAEVRRRAGVDLRGYKPGQMQRRLQGLMLRAGVHGWHEYLRLLDEEPMSRQELRRCISVTVSEFFRTPAQFEYLRKAVLPRLLEHRRRLRVWSAGCSYGAEPYSVALLLHDLAPEHRHLLFATDVDELGLARARAADSFSERDVRQVPSDMRRHFTPGRHPGQFALAPEVRSSVRFARHDLLTGRPEGDFDLIVCRNVMMYFTDEAKRQLFAELHEALRRGGYLFVGHAEVLNQLPEAGFTREAVGFYRK
jgi:chemotaxis protein methyltransferase CheR